MISLQKGATVSLKKEDQSLEILEIGLGWDTKTDLDTMAFLFDQNGKIQKIINFVNKKESGIFLNGDNLTGQGAGDDEIITVNLRELPKWVQKVSFGANIFAAKIKLWGVKDFSQVKGAYIRIVNKENKKEICRYDLKENGKGYNAFYFADLIRQEGDEWKFAAVGRGMNGSAEKIAKQLQEK